jgi:hypothetical protein
MLPASSSTLIKFAAPVVAASIVLYLYSVWLLTTS